jgi:SAM-dependent methyltransferase
MIEAASVSDAPVQKKQFDYEKDTRLFYQDAQVANEYHASFTSEKGIGSIRFKIIAARERAVIETFVGQCPHHSILDVPAGTGKLASLLCNLGSKLVCVDISKEMLAIAKSEYEKLNRKNVEFIVCGAEELTTKVGGHFDVAICLRLMQRVPRPQKLAILEQLARTATYAIVSFGYDSPWQRVRRWLRRKTLGGQDIGESTLETISGIQSLTDVHFTRVADRPVLPLLSQERVWLLRSRFTSSAGR